MKSSARSGRVAPAVGDGQMARLLQGIGFTDPATFFVLNGLSTPWASSLVRQTQGVKFLEMCFSDLAFAETLHLIADEPFSSYFLGHRKCVSLKITKVLGKKTESEFSSSESN